VIPAVARYCSTACTSAAGATAGLSVYGQDGSSLQDVNRARAKTTKTLSFFMLGVFKCAKIIAGRFKNRPVEITGQF
jgi:hypothetical protein